ncbi:vomeronasal type-2 receptor 116-like [Arvicanthis niloticus]|uniref:vomeronasal type-2 receptor 116-like n=1 Tax=Arvicanthis niloticus TaxID=61156 RepID=UPI00148707A1|nr:vomeronasal type-2 receptor 116-like [Arvicanthis niloticus]
MAKMFSLIGIFLGLKLSFLFCHLSDPRCFWRIKDKENYLGDKEADCFFSIYTRSGYVKNDYFSGNLDKQVTPKTIHLISSVYFAIEEINRNIHILPNISLLVNIQCNLMLDHVKGGLSLKRKDITPNYYCTNQRRYLIILTGPLWITSYKFGPILYFSRTPEIFCGYSNFISDQEQFPHLYQMTPKDTSLPLAIVSLVVHFSWNWVGVIITDDDHGIQFLSELRAIMERNTVCLSFVTMITYNNILYIKMMNTYYHQIIMSSAKVVIVYGDKESPVQLNFMIWKFKNIQRLWVSVSQFDMITMVRDFMLTSLYGTLIFSHQQSEMSGFKQFMQTVHPSNYSNDISFAKLWWTYFKCSLPPPNCITLKNCPTQTLLKWFLVPPLGISMSESCFSLYNAVHAVAHSLHEMLLQHVDTCSENDGKLLEFNSWKMFSFLKTIQFSNPSGHQVNMNQNKKLDTEYDIFYIVDILKQYGLKMKIGRFSGHFPNGQQLFMSGKMIDSATDIKKMLPSICSMPCRPGLRKYIKEGKAPCCFDCYPCPENEVSNRTDMDQCVMCPEDEYANTDQTNCLKKIVTFLDYKEPLGMALAGLALSFSALTAIVLCVFLKHRETPIVKANNETLSYVLLISLIFCFLCSLLYIGHPSTASCMLQQTTFAIVFTVAASSVLAKTITVVLAFKITVPGRRLRWLLLSRAPNYIIPICTMIQMILCGIWLGTSPPFVDVYTHMIHGHIIIVCNKGFVISFYCVLGYMGSLALASFTVAFLARNLPDTFNEAKLLTFSMLVFCSVWITFLPVYHSTKGKAMVAVEVFCILASSAGMLLCIFVPKCYIILLRPQINSFHEFRKMQAKSKNIN